MMRSTAACTIWLRWLGILILIGVTVLPATARATAPSTVIGWGNDRLASVPTGLSEVTAIAAGTDHSLALRSDGTVVAWGGNDFGQSSVPEGLRDVTAIAAGTFHNLALKRDGTVVTWGEFDGKKVTVPAGLNDVIAIAASALQSMALKRDGTVVVWTVIFPPGFTFGPAPSGVTAISAGMTHGLALRGDGTVVAWGSNEKGQSMVPDGLRDVTAVAAGASYSLALKSDGTVVGWGDNAKGQATVPAGLDGVIAIAAGGSHSLALKSDGTVVAWGDTSDGKATVPGELSRVTAIAAGESHSLALGELVDANAPGTGLARQEQHGAGPTATPDRAPSHARGAPAGALRLPGDPPAVGDVVAEDPLSAPGAIPGSLRCPSGRAIGDFVGEGYILKITGRCRPEATTAAAQLPPIPDLIMPDGEISVEAKAVSGHDRLGFWIMFRGSIDPFQGYAVDVFPATGEVALSKIVASGVVTPLAHRNDLSGRISRDDWNGVSVRLDGANLWILVNGQPVLSASDDHVDRGWVSLGARRIGNVEDNTESAVVFRNLRISRLATGQ